MLDEILKIYCGKDELNHRLWRPCLIEDHVYATDGHQLIKVPSMILNKVYEYTPGFPNVVDLLKGVEPKDKFNLPIANIQNAISGLEEIDLYQDCGNCKGTGEAECYECGSFVVCEKCNGSGHTEEVIGKTIESVKIVLKDLALNSTFLRNLVKVAEDLSEDTVRVHISSPVKAVLFKFFLVDVVIMPVRLETEDIKSLRKIETEATLFPIKQE